MIESINKVELQGYVGSVSSSENVTKFSLCTSTILSSKDGPMIVQNDWHLISIVNSLIKDKLIKGKGCHVFGRLKTQRYVSSEGIEQSMPLIVADSIEIFNE